MGGHQIIVSMTVISLTATHSLFHSRLKTLLFCKSFPPQPFFFFFGTDYMIPLTFTVTSGHIRFYFLVFPHRITRISRHAENRLSAGVVAEGAAPSSSAPPRKRRGTFAMIIDGSRRTGDASVHPARASFTSERSLDIRAAAAAVVCPADRRAYYLASAGRFVCTSFDVLQDDSYTERRSAERRRRDLRFRYCNRVTLSAQC